MRYNGGMSNRLATILFLIVGCGDNIKPAPDAGRPRFDLPVPPISGDICPGDDTAPDAAVPQDPDAGTATDTKGACCNALLNGGTPPHECGFPPGVCKNGKREMVCGTQAFVLCNPLL